MHRRRRSGWNDLMTFTEKGPELEHRFGPLKKACISNFHRAIKELEILPRSFDRKIFPRWLIPRAASWNKPRLARRHDSRNRDCSYSDLAWRRRCVTMNAPHAPASANGFHIARSTHGIQMPPAAIAHTTTHIHS
jgi:hypothetical protein